MNEVDGIKSQGKEELLQSQGDDYGKDARDP